MPKRKTRVAKPLPRLTPKTKPEIAPVSAVFEKETVLLPSGKEDVVHVWTEHVRHVEPDYTVLRLVVDDVGLAYLDVAIRRLKEIQKENPGKVYYTSIGAGLTCLCADRDREAKRIEHVENKY